MSLLLVVSLLLRCEDSPFPPLPEAVSSLGAAVCDGYVYTYGGHAGKTHSYSNETTSGAFRRLALANPSAGWEALPGGRKVQGLALVSYRGKLYRLGGMEPRNGPGKPADNHSTAECSVFDPVSRVWSQLPPFPEARSSHDAVVVGNTLVVIGGWKMQGAGKPPVWLDTFLLMDLSRSELTWESLPQPFQRRALQLAAKDGLVFSIGGLTSDGEIEKSVEVFDLANRTWTSAPGLPGPMMNGFTPGVAVADGHLYASPWDGILYRHTSSSWEPIAALNVKRFVHRLAPLPDGSLLALGGASKQGNVAHVERVIVKGITPAVAEKPVVTGQQEYCPIMTTTLVDHESVTVEWQGLSVRLCCKTCLKKWNADPAAYLRPEVLPQLQGKSIPKREFSQVFCPVYRDRVVSTKDPYVEYQGVRIYVFNQSAKQKFEKEPAKYADPRLLPQLKATPR